MSEKAFENKIKKFLKNENCYFIKYWGGGIFTQEGVPDIIACCNGHFLGIEVKAENGRPSELQKYNIEQIKKSGGIGLIVYPKDFEKLKNIIRSLNEGVY